MLTQTWKPQWGLAVSLLSSACGMIGLEPLQQEPTEELDSQLGGSASVASGGEGATSGGGSGTGQGGEANLSGGSGGSRDMPCEPGRTFCDGLWFTACDSEGRATSKNCALASRDQCTHTFCDDTLGCGEEAADDGAPCDDGLFCSVGDQCLAGSCQGGAMTSCDTLVASFGFEGSVRDETLNGNDASTVSSVSYEPGVSGQAIRLDTSSAVYVPDSPSLDFSNSLTIDAWVFPDVIPETGRVGVIDNDGQWGLFIYAGGQVRCTAIVLVDSPAPISSEEWTHLSCVYDGSFARLYVNGIQVAETPATGPLSTTNANAVTIGGNSPSGDRFTGLLDTMRVWSSALGPNEICTIAGSCP